jgi:NADH-quinone oxidoreductase subunit H
MFFLGEYSNMMLMSAFTSILFLGGWSNNYPSVFIIKIFIMCFFFVLVRATFPRYRYDQLMRICWNIFLPLTLSYLFFIAFLIRLTMN